jgi:hypothetical protein
MDKDIIRLELVKLTYHHGREVAETVRRAKELEEYVLQGVQKEKSNFSAKEKSKAGNS